MRLKLLTTIVLLTVYLNSCQTRTPYVGFGIQQGHQNFIPARTAVLKCQLWPNGSRHKSLLLSNVETSIIKDTCKLIDGFVIDGFKGQPYMRGLSPKAVEKSLKKYDIPIELTKIDELWQHRGSDCVECDSGPWFYESSIAPRQEWQTWLVEFSKQVKNADALLMPFLTYLNKDKVNDRGLATATVEGEIIFLLVDTNSGDLIWSGGRRAQASNKTFINETINQEKLEYPAWNILYERLLRSDVWREYPGYQNVGQISKNRDLPKNK